MVAGMAAPAYADVYYIGDGNITITKDESGTYVKHSGNPTATKDNDGKIVIKGGKRSEDTPASGSGSSEGTTPAKSPAQSNLTTLNSEDDSDNEAEDKVYLGDTKGGGEENKNQPSGTTGGEKNETDSTKKTQTGDSPVLGSQLTYTGASLKVADANDDDETRDESTTALKTAAENFRNTAENVTNYVIQIINKVKASTLNVTLEDVNIKANNDAALSVEGAGDTTITLKGDNTLTSDGKHAGLEHNEKSKDDNDDSVDTGKLTITSEKDSGILTATGGSGAAGIGGARNNGAGIIEIAGGNGSDGGAGIGSGSRATGNTTILIEGATKVTATGGSTAAGIGTGHYVGDINDPSVGSTTITIRNSADGTVIPIITAKGGSDENGSCQASGAGIGSGGNTLNKTIINIKGGEITATGGASYDPRNRGSWLSGAGIGSGSNVSGETEINIKGGTITKATGGKYGGAGIGGGSSDTKDDSKKGAVTINITGGTITEATGGSDYVDYVSSSERWYSGAGIGAGLNAGTTTINIKDNAHIVSATGGKYGGAGIGSGSGDTKNDSKKGAVTINITDGTIEKAEGKNGGAGIGSGYYGRSSTVNISGDAELKDVRGGNLAAGIGSGYGSDKVDVVIDGGTINATGGDSAAGIGSGLNSRSSVTIKSGTVNATGNGTGAGIGGSANNNSSSITITGGTIIANGTGEAPAIGGGSVSISNADAPLDITATAPDAANAIQSNDGKTLDKVISLMENGKKGLVKLVESGTNSLSRLFHNGVYAASHSTSHSPDRVTPEMSEAEKAKYGDIASVHNWTVSDHQEPNCGEDGYIKYTCMVDHCGTTFRHTLPATGQHTWNEGVVTKEPTCTELGVRTFTCTVCHNTRTEDIEAPGHEYGEWVIDRDATCVKEGSKHRDCVRGDATQTESIPATGQHQWKVLSTTAATCGQDGTVTYQCEVCNETKTETLNATGQHSYGAGVVTKAATCAEPGIMTYTCVVCGAPKTESIPVDKSTHKWDAGVVTKEPTCTADGVRTFTCSVCGDTRTEAIKALGHEYGEWVIDRDATCVEEGSKHRDCIRGDDTQTEAIPVSKTHTFGEWVITKEPTCTEKGEKQRSCTINGCVVTETEELPALGHQWSDWTPVEGDSSREYRICEVCNEVEYRDVSHNSDSSISTGLRVLDPAQTNIIQNVQLVQLSQINNTLYIDVAQETASLHGVLSDLTDLRSERIETVVFSTESCTSTLSLSDVAALGAGDTPFTLSHSGSTATFTVDGADHTALLR